MARPVARGRAGTAVSDEPPPFLDALSPAALAVLTSRAVGRRYQRGSAIFHQGDRADRVIVLRAGNVKVSFVTPEGKEVVFAFPARGEVLGELSAIDGEPRSATVTAVDAVDALVLTAADFRHALESSHELTLALLTNVARRLRHSNRHRVEFGAHDTVGRVALRLLELADRHGQVAEGGTRITLPLTQEELAGWTGTSREAVAKALRLLRELGWVRTDRRQVTLLDPEALRRRAL